MEIHNDFLMQNNCRLQFLPEIYFKGQYLLLIEYEILEKLVTLILFMPCLFLNNENVISRLSSYTNVGCHCIKSKPLLTGLVIEFLMSLVSYRQSLAKNLK